MIEGEGSFSLTVQRRKENFHVTPSFNIVQANNAVAMAKVKEILQNMGIESHLYSTKHGFQSLQVFKISECMRMASVLSHVLWYGKKGEVFECWRKGLVLLVAKKHLNEDGFKELLELRDMMLSHSKRYNAKYKTSFFSDRTRIGDESPLWSEAEIQIIRDNYADQNVESLMKLLPKRNHHSIENKACELGLRRERNRFRARLDGIKISELYSSGLSCEKIGDVMGVASSTIHKRLKAMGIQLRPPIAPRRRKT